MYLEIANDGTVVTYTNTADAQAAAKAASVPAVVRAVVVPR